MRAFTSGQKALLRSDLKARLLLTMFLDSGTYRFCDDVVDCTDGVDTYIGAASMVERVEVRSGQDFAAEPITLVVDGNRMTELGVADPAKVFAEMMDEMHHQRRTNFALGLAEPNSANIQMIVPLHAGKINHCILTDDEAASFDEDGMVEIMKSRLHIVIDALASRYGRSTFRTRSHADQLEIDPTDNFFSYVANVQDNELTLYWGKASPRGTATSTGGNIGGAGSTFAQVVRYV